MSAFGRTWNGVRLNNYMIAKDSDKFLRTLLEHVGEMEQQSYILLKDHKLDISDEVYDRVYKINQSGHEIKRLISIYGLR